MRSHGKSVLLAALVACVVLIGATLVMLRAAQVGLQRTAAAPSQTVPLPTAPISPLPPAQIRPVGSLTNSLSFCKFDSPQSQIVAEVQPSQVVVFSEPRVVFQAASNVGVGQWLPDDQRVLLAYATDDSDTAIWETLDIATARSQVVGKQNYSSLGPPIWLPDQEKILMRDFRFVEGPNGRVNWGLWLAGADIPDAIPLLNYETAYSATVDSSGTLVRLQTAGESPVELPQTVTAVRLPPPLTLQVPSSDILIPDNRRNMPLLLSVAAARSSDARRIAIVSPDSTFLANAELGTLCQVDLGMISEKRRRAFAAQWSPDGQWLALQTTAGEPSDIMPFMDVTLLNVNTGVMQHIPAIDDVFEVEWSPDSRYLLLLLDASKQRGVPGASLALFDISTNQVEPILPGWYFASGGAQGLQMAWSDDGQHLAIACPLDSKEGDLVEGQLCIVDVQMKH